MSLYPAQAHGFPRLTLRYKASLVQLEGGTQHLDLGRPEARAQHLSPQQWRAALQGRAGGAGGVLLDVRNGYEWDAGRFAGAARPPTESFRETVAAYSAPGGPLAEVAPDTPIMMYCTGGIRSVRPSVRPSACPPVRPLRSPARPPAPACCLGLLRPG